MYGRKVPLETDAERMRMTGLQAKGSVFGTLLSVVLVGLVFTLPRLGLQGWLPFTLSTFFVFVSLQFFRSLTMAIHKPAAGPGSSPVA
jgi:hypothetical protein